MSEIVNNFCKYVFLPFLTGIRWEKEFKFNHPEEVNPEEKTMSYFQMTEVLTGNGILLPKLFWPTVRKNCSSDRKNSWNSRLKADNLQTFWDR